MTARRSIALVAAIAGGAAALGSGPKVFTDAAGDAVLRRTDVGNDGPLNPAMVMPDLLSLTIGPWIATNPVADPYAGDWDPNNDSGDILRIDLVFAGVVNPPGNVLGGQPFNPFRFGPSPLHGFLELDVDRDRNSGGECGDPALFRYLANVGRFGAVPYGSISERMARDGQDLNTQFASAPQIERSGAEFVVSFCGCFNVTVVNTFGDPSPSTFGAGDTWIVSGRFFQRAGGFESVSAVFGGSFPGRYDPIVKARFRHDAQSDTTTVSIVYPLTPTGAGLLAGAPAQPIDLNVGNQNCVQEALQDVIDSASKNIPYGCVYELIDRWDGRDSDDNLRPADWDVSALFGTTYTTLQAPYYYAWTDVGFDERVGDFDGGGVVNSMDQAQIDSEIASLDGGSQDGDGAVNGSVTVVSFASAFNVHDVTGDGVINSADRAALGPALVGDLNGDCVVNFADLNLVVSFFNTGNEDGDVNGDGLVNFADLNLVVSNFNVTCP